MDQLPVNLNFMTETQSEEWDVERVSNWILVGLKTDNFSPLKLNRRLHEFGSTYLIELFEESDIATQNLIRAGINRALRLWTPQYGILMLQELAILAGHTRALESLNILRSIFDRKVDDLTADDLYEVRGNILYHIRNLTAVGDKFSYSFFLDLYKTTTDIRFLGQIVLGLIESRPQGTDPLLIKEYISHFLRIALEKDGFFDEDDIETFFGALIDTLGVGNLMEAVRISAPRQGRFGRIGQNFAFVRRLQRSSRQTITTQQLADQPVFAIAQHLLASPASGYWIHYKGNVPQAIFTYDDPINPHIVSQAPLPTWYSDSEIDPLLQQQSAYNESTKMLQNSVGQVNELLNALPI